MREFKEDSLAAHAAALIGSAPDAPLVLSPSRRATAAEVDALAGALERRLAAVAVAGGSVVALAAANGPGFLAALLALSRSGCAALLLDPRAPAAVRRRLAAGLGAAHLLAAASPWPTAADWSLEPLAGTARPAAGTAVIKLTSGSTGAARGIATPAAALLADERALAATMGLGDRDRLLAAVPMSHSYGLSSLAVPALVRGLPLVVPDDDGPFALFTAAAACGATVLPTVPAYLDAVTRMAEPPPLPATLRLVLTAGAPLSAASSRRFRERFGLPVHVFYGASECGGICYDQRGGGAERGVVGAPVAGVEVSLEPVEGAAGGRVVVRSPAVAAGYLPGPEPRLAGGRFASEDLGCWRDGELALIGRLDDMINVKGKKVNPREIEEVLRGLEAVDDVRVLGVTAGADGPPIVRAVIACRAGTLDCKRVLRWCRERLVDHQVPRSVVLVDRLPVTERGKVDRAVLEALGD